MSRGKRPRQTSAETAALALRARKGGYQEPRRRITLRASTIARLEAVASAMRININVLGERVVRLPYDEQKLAQIAEAARQAEDLLDTASDTEAS